VEICDDLGLIGEKVSRRASQELFDTSQRHTAGRTVVRNQPKIDPVVFPNIGRPGKVVEMGME
jgi:hypothetical protein